MDKLTGQELKSYLQSVQLKERNIIDKINKRFDFTLNQNSKYIPDNYKTLLSKSSIYDLDIKTKLDIIIATEDNYYKQTTNQISLF